jgi:quinoprotein glucose dehydrogenase
VRKFAGLLGVAALAAGIWAASGKLAVQAQGRAGGPAPAAVPAPAVPGSEWRTYGADLASTRYSPLDQINKDNFKNLEIAWRLNTNPFGPRPDNLYSATPLMVKGTIYTTVGSRRGVTALDPATGEVRWLHTEDEGVRGQSAPRNGSGRGVAYWSSADGRDERIIYVTPGYRMLALSAKTGVPVATFGADGVVDLKRDFDQPIENIDTADVGLNATPLVVGDVVVVGAAHRFAGARGTNTVKG